MNPGPIALIILDGWGHREAHPTNAVTHAHTPVWDALWQKYPHTTLSASGLDVGLPKDQMGNSEVGHLTMGAGRAVLQELTRISTAIETDSFTQNPILNEALDIAVQDNQTLHILGLLSPGGVHSHEKHIHALIKMAAEKGLRNILIHAFLDGRDTPPKSATASLALLQQICGSLAPNQARIASICGRFYAMDRDKRWERTKSVYELLTEGKAPFTATSALEALDLAYQRHETDEFVQPTLIIPAAHIQENDQIIFMNFRSDRARQLCTALRDPDFSAFKRSVFLKNVDFVTLTDYAQNLKVKVAYPTPALPNMLGEYLQRHQLRQLRIAETEKYAHVTFFFNGGREKPFAGEDRILISSKKVATYDLCPEMSALELTQQFVAAIKQKSHNVIICNYANADMVGHTGNFSATIKAIETLDVCLGQVLEALKAVNGEALITADHGNAEQMFDDHTQQPHTAHTLERVPAVYIGRSAVIIKENGTLADIAPTLLHLIGLPIPIEMTGTSLIRLNEDLSIDLSIDGQYDGKV